MKILILSTHLNIGGISSYMINLAKGLKAKGIEVVIATSGGVLEGVLKKEGIQHYYIDIDAKSELSPKIIKSIFVLNELIKQEKFDLIHAQTRVTQVLAFLVSRFSGVPYVSTCHGFYKFRLNRKLFPCFGKFVIAVSRQVEDELNKKLHIKQDKIKLVLHGIDIEKNSKGVTLDAKKELKKKLNLKENSFVLGSIGRFASEKGHKFLVSAFKQVNDKYSNTELILIGVGRLKDELVEQVKNLRLENKVHFLGERFDLENIYPAMDIFCFPSLRESFGFSVLEALSCGIPVVASNIGELKYLVEDGKNGFLCRPGDSEAFAFKINYLIGNKDLLSSMQKEATQIVNRNFSISRMTEDTIAVYKQALGMKKILVVGVNWLGDSLFTFPFINALRENFKDSFIAVMAVPSVLELYKNNSCMNEVIVYDEKGKDKSIFGKFRIISVLKEKKFDTAFVLRPSFSRTFICYLAGIKERIGFNSKKHNLLLTKRIAQVKANTHRIDQNLKILEDLGLTINDRTYHFEAKPKEDDFIARLLLENGIKDNEQFILINAGGNWLTKRWNYKNFAQLADRIIQELNLKVVISGAQKDIELVSSIQGLMKNMAISICGKTNLLELASLMKRALLVVSADSGPMHLAASVGAKVVALFGPTSPLITGPYPLDKHIILSQNVDCKIPCFVENCENIRCMDAITVDEVFKSVKREINKPH